MRVLVYMLLIVIISSCTGDKKMQTDFIQEDKFGEDIKVYSNVLSEIISKELDYHSTSIDSICIIMENVTSISDYSKSIVKKFLDSDFFFNFKRVLANNLLQNFSRNKKIRFQEVSQDYKIISHLNRSECDSKKNQVYLNISRVGFNEDYSSGVFFYAWNCGKLCGNGYLVFVHKKGGDWEIDQKIPVWVS